MTESTLKELLSESMKSAMKAKDKNRLKTIRLALSDIKRVELFEFRDYLGELLNSKKSLETCYKEYKLIS